MWKERKERRRQHYLDTKVVSQGKDNDLNTNSTQRSRQGSWLQN